jgi:2-(1,2-epoxy-1,2-dihydrophenyl)acetyl-CoA isomerase
MEFATLIFARRGAVASVTLNRPDRLNALNEALIADLRAVAATIAADTGVRAVLLTGSGRAFCSGADLMRGGILDADADADAAKLGAAVGASLREQFNPMVSAWYALPVPVVVAVHGIAAGAGASLALSGDIVLAARSAKFLQLFAPKLGLLPDLGGTFHLPRLIGSARAKGLAMLGGELTASDAAAWGMIWACVEDAALAGEAENLAQALAAGPTQAYARIKAVLNVGLPHSLDEQLAIEAEAQSALADTEDFSEGLLAFRTKRAPLFRGR